ncbi:MAG: hypothetical protein U0R65_15670 [Candidatus Nanopelagicales bacterium]
MRPTRQRVRLTRVVPLLAALVLLVLPASASAFDTGPHSDITRDALTSEGFGRTATDVAVVSNWFVDLYSNSSKIPQSGHAKTSVEILGSLFGPRENWPTAVLEGAGRMHFDSSIWDVYDVHQAQKEWDRLQRATTQAIRSIKSSGGPNREAQLLVVIGLTLHALQDFYSHSNWIEETGVTGADGTDWSKLTMGRTPTWFDVPQPTRDGLNVYIGESTGHKARPHGAWNTEGNTKMFKGVNKDWPGRPGYDGAYMTAYFATRQWVQALRGVVADDALWTAIQRYANRKGTALDHDLKYATKIGVMTGHWSGQGEPCDPSLSLNVCGSRNGLGGDLIGARNAIRDYFDRDRTYFRGLFQSLIPLFGQQQPNGDLFPVSTSWFMQHQTRFVRARVTSMKSVGLLRSLGDPTLLDQADMFGRATVAGQGFQSGEINGRDSFSFPKPYAPFEYLKAITDGQRFPEPVTSLSVEIRTSSATFSGTDDDVYLRVGPNLRFNLDKRLYNDFERGDRDTYSVPIDDAVLAGLSVGDLDRLWIEKSSDGVAGGWKLRGVKLMVNGRTVYERDGIERWLEDDHRVWKATDFQRRAPDGTTVPVTLDLWDEDSFVYGGDDHGDIEPNDRRKRLALAYVPGSVVRDRATGGSRYSGRIGDGDKASITYEITTLTPSPPAAPVAIAPPAVRIDEPAEGATFEVGQRINLRGSAYDATDGDLSDGATWLLDGQPAGTGARLLSLAIPSQGPHTVTLSSKNSGGLVGTSSIKVNVVPATGKPSVTITEPALPPGYVDRYVVPGTPFTLTASAQAQGTATIPNSGYVWRSDLSGTLGTGPSIQATLPTGTHQVTVTVTDSLGRVATDTVKIISQPIIG